MLNTTEYKFNRKQDIYGFSTHLPGKRKITFQWRNLADITLTK